ncbi:MAG: tetratricopeptide repeat protein [bacterium]
MNNHKIWVAGFFMILLVGQAFCLPFESDITKGNRFYCKSKFNQAEELYSKAASRKEMAAYNLGNALYKQGKFMMSERVFNALIQTKNEKFKEKVYYNQGNAQFRQGNYKSAVSSYEQALKIAPEDKDTKYNLSLAKKMLKMPPKSQKQNQQNKQQQQKRQNPNKGKGMSREDAERILQSIATDEGHRGKKIEGRGMGNGLDW